jgi:hypothetical protein
MRAHTRLLLASATAIVVLAAMASHAFANRLEWSERSFRIVWTNFEWAFEGGGGILCPVTMEGTWHARTFVKRAELLIGHVTAAAAAAMANCMGGSMTPDVTTPWNVRYDGFTGRLPAITGLKVRIVSMRFSLFDGIITCILTTEATKPFKGTFNVNAAGEALTFTPDPTGTIELVAGSSMLCFFVTANPAANAGNVTLLGVTTKLRVRLI